MQLELDGADEGVSVSEEEVETHLRGMMHVSTRPPAAVLPRVCWCVRALLWPASPDAWCDAAAVYAGPPSG
jgi:hypothetical protein